MNVFYYFLALENTKIYHCNCNWSDEIFLKNDISKNIIDWKDYSDIIRSGNQMKPWSLRNRNILKLSMKCDSNRQNKIVLRELNRDFQGVIELKGL